jgi:hypothetical protein
MIFFWWSGRGYLTVLIILATLSVAGLLYPLLGRTIGGSPLYWGFALLAAAVLNWHFGSRLNRKKIAVVKAKTVKDRLLYRARHTFMTVPMETFSLAIVLFAIGTVAFGLS